MAFELVDDRPMVRETCETCGTVRRYRAWERYWTPGAGERRG
jgi:RNase P subunit RPR2